MAKSYRNIITIFIFLFVLLDLVFSTYQYYHLTIDGDVTKLAAPIEWYKDVLNDPFGFKAVSQNIEYGGAGRYMTHASIVLWYKYANQFVRFFIQDPVVAIFLTSALFAAFLYVLYLFLVSIYIGATQKLSLRGISLVLVLSVIFIQFNKYYESIGIIDRSISYTFFYALSLFLLALFFYPMYRKAHNADFQIPIPAKVMMLMLPVYLAFHGPLVQPVVFVVALLLGIAWFMKVPSVRRLSSCKFLVAAFVWFLILCLYGFYVSKYNSEKNLSVPLLERYGLLAKGIFYILTNNLAWLCIFATLFINYVLLHTYHKAQFKQSISLLFAVLLFSVVYLGLLPLGGYRSYRPYIVRYDTLLPVTLLFLFLLIHSSVYLLENASKKLQSQISISVALLLVFIFSNADKKVDRNYNECQQQSLYKLHKSADTVLYVSHECNLGTWQVEDLKDPYALDMLTRLFIQWQIIKPYQVLK